MSTLPNANRVVFDLTFVQDAYNELPPHMQDKENLVKLLLVFAKRFDTLQKEVIKLSNARFLDNAEGVMLDNIADRLFIRRSSQNDESLRGAIKLRALRQDSEGTRDEIVKLLKIISNNDYVKVFKTINNYVEVIFPSECLSVSEVKVELSDLFPINTNLVVGSLVMGKKAFGVVSKHNPTPSDKVGALESKHNAGIEIEQTVAVKIISDERDL